MGDRRNVIIKYDSTGVVLYTHWTGSNLPTVLKAALKRGESRWNDPGYLTRIIFSEMIRDAGPDALTELLGFGIYPMLPNGSAPCEDSPGYDIVIDAGLQTVDGVPFTDYTR